MTAPGTAHYADMARCHCCALLAPLPKAGTDHGHSACPRCGAALHARKSNNLTRCWALVITAFILYIPANVFPIMTVTSFGRGAPDTIMSGVIHLVEASMWPLAAIVFFASVLVPLTKLFALSYLLISVQRRSKRRPRDRTVLYRITESVGRWSMIDVFVISILVALVQLGNIASIEPGIGATAFAAVVIITILAAESFDPRLIWDAAEDGDE